MRRNWTVELDQVGQVVVTVVEQRGWEAQGSVRISEMYLERWCWCPGWTRKNHINEFQVILPEKRFSVIRWFEPVSDVQVGFVRAEEEGECQELCCSPG
jgi:hypothetical protein